MGNEPATLPTAVPPKRVTTASSPTGPNSAIPPPPERLRTGTTRITPEPELLAETKSGEKAFTEAVLVAGPALTASAVTLKLAPVKRGINPRLQINVPLLSTQFPCDVVKD